MQIQELFRLPLLKLCNSFRSFVDIVVPRVLPVEKYRHMFYFTFIFTSPLIRILEHFAITLSGAPFNTRRSPRSVWWMESCHLCAELKGISNNFGFVALA